MKPFTLIALCVAGCGSSGGSPDGGPADAGQRRWAAAPALLEPVSNNAVASLELAGGCMVFSALGIDATLSGTGAHNRAYRLRDTDTEWLALPDVPGPGRLASSAVGIGESLYVLGGYSIGIGGAETSHDSLQRFDLTTGKWVDEAPLLTAIDDAVAMAWRDRWIVIVSGWSNTRSVDAVQIYDTQTRTWQNGTPFPGTPVFGHAGALSGDTLVVIDGAASSAGFPITAQAWRGELSVESPGEITWTDLGVHPGPPRYRAAAGTDDTGRLLFHGGTDTPYNFDGLRYDNNQPSVPLASTLVFDPAAGTFSELLAAKPVATMDHRNLARCGTSIYTVGGMIAGPAATADTWLYR